MSLPSPPPGGLHEVLALGDHDDNHLPGPSGLQDAALSVQGVGNLFGGAMEEFVDVQEVTIDNSPGPRFFDDSELQALDHALIISSWNVQQIDK